VKRIAPGNDVVVVEVGGTVGDIESQPFLEAIRQLRTRWGRRTRSSSTSRSCRTSRRRRGEDEADAALGARADGDRHPARLPHLPRRAPLTEDVKRKIALFCNVDFGAVVESVDVPTIYEIPLAFHAQGFDARVCQRLGLEHAEPDLSAWRELVRRVVEPRARRASRWSASTPTTSTATRACRSRSCTAASRTTWASTSTGCRATCSRRERGARDPRRVRRAARAGGFGVRGVEGMVEAIRAARETGLPFFGICLGMQTAIIEFARNVCGISDSHSSEFAPECANAVSRSWSRSST
jgi:CTP synthase